MYDSDTPILYRYAIISKSSKTWTLGPSSGLFIEVTTKTLPDLAFKKEGEPPLNTGSLNSIYCGLFWCPNGGNVTNSPTTNPFFLECQQIKYATLFNNEYIKQILTDFTTNDVYYRTCNNGTWSSWYKITATVVS